MVLDIEAQKEREVRKRERRGKTKRDLRKKEKINGNLSKLTYWSIEIVDDNLVHSSQQHT